jgi:uncharacterized repeat protein (TIGR03803 family)
VTPAGVGATIYSFGTSISDGVEPMTLAEGLDGNLYGTTLNGGANACSTQGETHDCGTVFKVTPAGTETVLYSFGHSISDAIAPMGAFFLAKDGNFYGTTVSGGGGQCFQTFGCGTVYRITPTGQFTIIYAFGSQGDRSDGYGPNSLIQGRDGNFYGTTANGGANGADGNGTAFMLTPSGTKTILYSFGPYPKQPTVPAELIQAADGSFYGVTAYAAETVFTSTAFRMAVN